MAKNTSVVLGDHFEAFVASRVESGKYANASDVIRAALRRLEAEETKEAALVRALIRGEESGTDNSYSLEATLAEIDAL